MRFCSVHEEVWRGSDHRVSEGGRGTGRGAKGVGG